MSLYPALRINYDDEAQSLAFFVGGTPVADCSVASFEQFYQRSYKSLNFNFMPPAVRWISSDLRQIVFERPPCYQKIGFSTAYASDATAKGKADYSFYLPFPWTIYVIHLSVNYGIESIYGYFARSSILGKQNPNVYPFPMHNWYTNAMLCMPPVDPDPGDRVSLFSIVDITYDMIWNSDWNLDLRDNVMQQSNIRDSLFTNIPKKIRNIHHPNFSVEYYKAWTSLTVDQMINRIQYTNGVPMSTVVPSAGIPDNNVQRDVSRILMAAQNASVHDRQQMVAVKPEADPLTENIGHVLEEAIDAAIAVLDEPPDL